MDLAQTLEDLLEDLRAIQKDINKLKTASVSGQALRNRVKDANKRWLPVEGLLGKETSVSSSALQEVSESWAALAKLANNPSPKKQYKSCLKTIVSKSETELLHKYIKASAISGIGDPLRKLVQPISDPKLLQYLDESIRCAETNCIRASAVLAWCAVAHKVHAKLGSLGIPQLNAEFQKMKTDKGLLFKTFSKDYVFTTTNDIPEAADAHLILMCRFLTYLDDTQYKRLKSALDLRNGCGHPTGYQPDSVNLQAFYSDITQLVLLNPTFA